MECPLLSIVHLVLKTEQVTIFFVFYRETVYQHSSRGIFPQLQIEHFPCLRKVYFTYETIVVINKYKWQRAVTYIMKVLNIQ